MIIVLPACSNISPATSTTQALTDPAPASDSVSGQDEWVMEGYSPQRDRATTDDIEPPLMMLRELVVGGDTQFGSPVGIARSLLFVEGRRKLFALALVSGEEQWQFDMPGSFLSPAVAGNSVFVRAESGEDGYVLALSADAGLKLWQYKFPHVGSSYDNVGGHVTSPVVAGGLVLVGASQSFRALDAETGSEVWVFDTESPIASSATVASNTVYFTDFTRLYAVDLRTGAEQWQFEHGQVTLFFSPVAIADEIIITSQNTVIALNRQDGQVLWSKTFSTEDLVPSAANGDRVYVKSVRQLYALDRWTGDLAWTYVANDFISLPALAGGHIYVITRAGGSGQLRALRRLDGQEVWQTAEARLANAAPVVAGGLIYVRTVDGSVLVYNRLTAQK